MKNLQKFMALGLAAAMVLSMTACGSSDEGETTNPTQSVTQTDAQGSDGSEQTTSGTEDVPEEESFDGMEMVVFSQMDLTLGGTDDSYYFQALIHHALDEWCLEHNATWSQMLTNDTNVLMSSIAAGQAPDLYFSYRQWPQVANLGLVQPISAYYDELADKYGASYLDILNYQGEYYGINAPWNELTTLRYNRTLFEELGVKTPKEYFLEGNWNWDTFRTVLQEITRDTDGDGINDIVGIDNYQMTSCFAPSIEVEENGEIHSLLNTDKNREFYQMLYEEVTLNKTMLAGGNVTLPSVASTGEYVAIGIHSTDIYDPAGLYSYDDEGNVIEAVPVPMWKEDDPEYGTKMNFFQFMVPTGAKSLAASISLMDYIVEAGCAIEMIPSGLTDYTFTGLRGTTPESQEYIEYRAQKCEQDKAEIEAMPEYDAEYVQTLLDYFDSTTKFIEPNYSGVTFAITNSTEWSSLWTTPAATSIAERYPVHEASCETYNSKFIFE